MSYGLQANHSLEATMRAALAGVVCGGLAMAGPALAVGPLSPKEIQAAFFNGQSFTASTPSNVKFTMVFSPNGKVTREPLGKAGSKGEGTWKLTQDGFCTSWKGGKSDCFRLLAGKNRWSVMKGTTVIAIWTR
jgi:hypothetical protein